MARSEGYSEGNVPLHTLRAEIDYASAEALTTYGKLGVKVWIYKGEILPGKTVEEAEKARNQRAPRYDNKKDNKDRGGRKPRSRRNYNNKKEGK